jgi:hypothetical protein
VKVAQDSLRHANARITTEMHTQVGFTTNSMVIDRAPGRSLPGWVVIERGAKGNAIPIPIAFAGSQKLPMTLSPNSAKPKRFTRGL